MGRTCIDGLLVGESERSAVGLPDTGMDCGDEWILTRGSGTRQEKGRSIHSFGFPPPKPPGKGLLEEGMGPQWRSGRDACRERVRTVVTVGAFGDEAAVRWNLRRIHATRSPSSAFSVRVLSAGVGGARAHGGHGVSRYRGSSLKWGGAGTRLSQPPTGRRCAPVHARWYRRWRQRSRYCRCTPAGRSSSAAAATTWCDPLAPPKRLKTPGASAGAAGTVWRPGRQRRSVEPKRSRSRDRSGREHVGHAHGMSPPLRACGSDREG